MDEVSADNREKLGRRKRFRVISLGFVTVLALLAWSCGLFQKMPADSDLQTRFFEHETEFTKLVRMSDDDAHVTLIRSNLTYLDTDASWPRKNIGISDARWDEYRQMFRKLHVDGIARRREYASAVFINVYERGGVLASAGKGYVYSQTPLFPLSDSLDAFPREVYVQNKGHALVFKILANNWYLFREEY